MTHLEEESFDKLKRENEELKQRIRQLELEESNNCPSSKYPYFQQLKLNKDEVQRYSRQLILQEIGVTGQLALLKSKVLIVGAGGLGSPAALYLAGAGIGCIGIIDFDEVELGNLHRQIIHTESRVGMSKAESAKIAIESINSQVTCIAYKILLDSKNALEIIKDYDIVMDATDNVSTRYLLNDSCVLLGKPLVSGAALRMEGQLTVYNYENGPCYRCLFPQPPPPETVTNCNEGGVLGLVPGIIGTLQAIEVVKIASGKMKSSYIQKMLLYDALQSTFRNIKLRGKRKECIACGDNQQLKMNGLIDYNQFCGSSALDKKPDLVILNKEDRITAKEYSAIVRSSAPHILIDCREKFEVEICSLGIPGTIYCSVKVFEVEDSSIWSSLPHLIKDLPVYVICRQGNRSQIVVSQMKKRGFQNCKDIIKGIIGWHFEVDKNFPIY